MFPLIRRCILWLYKKDLKYSTENNCINDELYNLEKNVRTVPAYMVDYTFGIVSE